MSKVMYRSDDSYVSCRAGVYYYIRRVPYDVRQHYASKRLSFSLKTKSYAGALRAAQSVTQRLEDYWLGLRLQDMDIPAIHLVKANHVDDSSPVMLDAVENYLRIKGNDDRIFISSNSLHFLFSPFPNILIIRSLMNMNIFHVFSLKLGPVFAGPFFLNN